ncbi:MAG: Y-family DNA polymerase [Bacteroidales bacterium]|nr:Y-family DNA polymerase [Bacteroidales bacterium]
MKTESVFALIDCNNFYASCEAVFQPRLAGRPVVVLSNNDGCVISRSEEAKAAGVKMGVPVFTIKEIIEENNVAVFSTNYTLYGDISQRVMNTLASFTPEIEIYSIDEAFLQLQLAQDKLSFFDLGKKIKNTVETWTGIPVSVGLGASKTLAKAAGYLAKKIEGNKGVCEIPKDTEGENLLDHIRIENLWGIGEKYSLFLQKNNIFTALELKNADDRWIRSHLGVMGQRIVSELNGTVCYPLNNNPDDKKEICTSRSFGKPLKKFEELEVATVSYVSRVGEKLRKQNLLARKLLVFIMTNKYATGPQYVNYKMIQLPVPTNNSSDLIHYTVIGLKHLFREGYLYKKSGIIVSELIPEQGEQLFLWQKGDSAKTRKLQKLMDELNLKEGKSKVRFAVEETNEFWKMKQEKLSQAYTTRWNDIMKIDLDKVHK